ncbi:MAG: ABC transporter substrate-binding protein [Firmicutes bacterium]|nr:ABC transporter substrate-binding protein [Bacillota bacterium]
MNVSKKLVALLCLGIMLCATLGADAAEKSVKVGVFGPLSGSLSVAGNRQREGAQFAADEINAAGGVLGYKLELIFEDDEGVPANTVNVMNKFLYRDRVVATMGSNNSPSVLAVLDIIKRAQTPHIVPSGVAYAITHSDNPWVFRVVATDEVFTRTLVDHGVKTLGFTRFAVIHDTNDYGQGGRDFVVKWLKGHGLNPVAVEGYNRETKDFTPQLLNIKNANPQALIIWGNYTEGAQLVRQIKAMNMPFVTMVSTGVTIGNFYELAGDSANGIIGITGGWHPDRTDPEALQFIEKYKKAKGYVPDMNVACAYDAVRLLARAMIDAGTATDKAKIREALSRATMDGITGRIAINEFGDGGTSALLFTVRNGKPVLLQ